MVVPKEGVIFAGDIIFAGRLPFLGDTAVDTDSWLNALDTLAGMDPAPRIVIPGHGEPFRNAGEAIRFTADYIRFLREHMGAAVEELEPFDQAYAEVDWSRYADLPAFEETNRRNAYSVYLEMEAESF
jgi:glyoxylase-like metal-dependent hydrolase (beta-lactamase superfamily II)